MSFLVRVVSKQKTFGRVISTQLFARNHRGTNFRQFSQQTCLFSKHKSPRSAPTPKGPSEFEKAKSILQNASESDFEKLTDEQILAAAEALMEQQTTELAPNLRKALEVAALRGNSQAQIFYGGMCVQGIGGDRDLISAVKSYLKAAKQGRPDAQFCLGILCDTKEELEPAQGETKKARGFLDEEEMHFDPVTRRLYLPEQGRSLVLDEASRTFRPESTCEKCSHASEYNPPPPPQSPTENSTSTAGGVAQEETTTNAQQQRKKTVTKFLPDEVIEILRQNTLNAGKQTVELNKNDTQAAMWYQKAADQGHPLALLKLGLLYLDGRGVTLDVSKAISLLQTAAEKGSAESALKLGKMHLYGDRVDQDIQKGLDYYSDAASMGSAEALFFLGCAYHDGTLVQQSLSDATQLLEAAARRHAPACLYLAEMYKEGQGVEKSFDKFLHYLQKACDLGDAHAFYVLGDLYFHGQDTVILKNYVRAAQYYREAGQKKHPEALVALGSCYFHGLGVEQSYDKAFDIYQKAVQAGSIDALRNLASMHYNGLGIERNEKVAQTFLEIAQEKEEALMKEQEGESM